MYDVHFVARSPGHQESLELFGKMTQGRLEEGSATLRLKMDMTSPNPNMWDQVGYRHGKMRFDKGKTSSGNCACRLAPWSIGCGVLCGRCRSLLPLV